MLNSKISPSNLGAMAAPNFCPKCFWRLLHLRFKKPFSFPMPGIMFYLDAHQKQLAKMYVAEHAALPKFFGRYKKAVGIVPMEWVEYTDEETGILVRGKPDLLLELPNGKIVVIDNKTAIHRGDDDVMFPRYRTQTNAYGAALMYGDPARKVEGLALLHYEFNPLSDEEILDYVDDDSIWTRFHPKLVDVELAPDKYVTPFLQTFSEFLDLEDVPDGREGCKDCELLDVYTHLIVEGRLTDVLIHSVKGGERDRIVSTLQYRRVQGADAYLAQHPDKLLPVVPQECDGLLANWDFSND